MTVPLPGGIGLWSGFLDRMSAPDAVAAARTIEAADISTIWLQEFSGVDPFVRAALYLQGTAELTVALGVATIHARDPEAMVAAAATLHEAFPGRFLLGLGTSHRQLAEGRGARYERPLTAMRDYLTAMDAVVGRRKLPPRFLGALGPRMVDLAAEHTGGVHTYFCPVAHTAAVRATHPDSWIAPTQLVALPESWRDGAREYLGFCLGMPNYRNNLRRFGFTASELDSADDRLLDALVVPDEPEALAARVDAHQAAGADHVVLQFIPPPRGEVVLDRVTTRPIAPG